MTAAIIPIQEPEDIEQRTDAWYQARLGKCTASRVADAVRKLKDGRPAATRENYKAELLIERLTGKPFEGYVSQAMMRGTELEPVFRSEYQMATGNRVELVGFVQHPVINLAGASPDGFVGEHGMVEFKCPEPAQHIRTLLGEPIDKDYIHQVQFQMACTGRQWVDWGSFNPQFPEELQLKLIRVARDQAFIDKLEVEVMKFLQDVDEEEQKLRAQIAQNIAG